MLITLFFGENKITLCATMLGGDTPQANVEYSCIVLIRVANTSK